MISIKQKNIAIFGDLILDQYTSGTVNRISPEAPVPIIKVNKQDYKLGGSGNVLLNLIALGMKSTIYGRIGNDTNGAIVKEKLTSNHITHHLITSESIPTIKKQRIISGNHQMLRIDYEESETLHQNHLNTIFSHFIEHFESYDAVVLSDYGKGFLTDELCQKVITYCHENNKSLPIIVDPKGHDFSKYKGATVITPNMKEATNTNPIANSIEDIAKSILEKTHLEFLLITRSQDGISYFTPEPSFSHKNFPVEVQEVTDVTGAGDTVVAVVTSCLANSIDHETMCTLCNIAGGYVVGHFGATTISAEVLLNQYQKNV